jgi:UDP-N-acetylmuramyl pentapeptide synthase
MGMNHAGELSQLTRLVRPHIAIVTAIAPAHTEFFADESAIADAKGEIFSGLEPGGVAIINRDTATFERLLAHARASRAGRVVSFGEHPEADVRALMAYATEHPEGPVDLNLKGKEALFGGKRISLDMRESSRALFLEGTWDSSATLLSAMAAVQETARKLPYLRWGSLS